LTAQVRKLVKIIALLAAIVWLPAVSHCMMEDAGWIASGQCCTEPVDDSHDAEPAHDECSVCFFESSAMWSIKSDFIVSAVQLDLLNFELLPLPGLFLAAPGLGRSQDHADSAACLRQLLLPLICPIRGPSLLS
jgi:hypothetical protein